jgi:hypothetical protein
MRGLRLGLSLTGGAAAFNPASVFAGGKQGALYLPGGLAGIGNPVDPLPDSSGNGFSAAAINAATLMQDAGGHKFLRFDGLNSLYNLASWMTTALMGDHTLVIAAIARQVPGAAHAMLWLTTAGDFVVTYLNDNSVGTGGTKLYANGDVITENIDTKDVPQVLTLRVTTGSQILRRNGAQVATATGLGSGVSGAITSALLGGGGGSFAQVDLYGLMLIEGALSAGNQAAIETYMGTQIGLTL